MVRVWVVLVYPFVLGLGLNTSAVFCFEDWEWYWCILCVRVKFMVSSTGDIQSKRASELWTC